MLFTFVFSLFKVQATFLFLNFERTAGGCTEASFRHRRDGGIEPAPLAVSRNAPGARTLPLRYCGQEKMMGGLIALAMMAK